MEFDVYLLRKEVLQKHNQYISRFSDFIIKESSKNNFPNEKILDVGSGTGEILDLIKKKGFDVTGVEPSIGQYKASKKFLDLDIENKFYEKSLFKKESFSLIYSFHSIEHFNEEPGSAWVQRLVDVFDHFVWINPTPKDYWEHSYSVQIMRDLIDDQMFPMTVKGLEEAMVSLTK